MVGNWNASYLVTGFTRLVEVCAPQHPVKYSQEGIHDTPYFTVLTHSVGMTICHVFHAVFIRILMPFVREGVICVCVCMCNQGQPGRIREN